MTSTTANKNNSVVDIEKFLQFYYPDRNQRCEAVAPSHKQKPRKKPLPPSKSTTLPVTKREKKHAFLVRTSESSVEAPPSSHLAAIAQRFVDGKDRQYSNGNTSILNPSRPDFLNVSAAQLEDATPVAASASNALDLSAIQHPSLAQLQEATRKLERKRSKARKLLSECNQQKTKMNQFVDCLCGTNVGYRRGVEVAAKQHSTSLVNTLSFSEEDPVCMYINHQTKLKQEVERSTHTERIKYILDLNSYFFRSKKITDVKKTLLFEPKEWKDHFSQTAESLLDYIFKGQQSSRALILKNDYHEQRLFNEVKQALDDTVAAKKGGELSKLRTSVAASFNSYVVSLILANVAEEMAFISKVLAKRKEAIEKEIQLWEQLVSESIATQNRLLAEQSMIL